MSGGYSRIVPFVGEAGTPVCVELPVPPRGTLDRLIITQISGTPGTGDAIIYDRKGACAGETDLNVDESGIVDSVTTAAGNASVEFTEAHNLKVGDTFEIKECDVADYNVTHTVTAVTSDVIVVTDVSYTSDGSGGVWQTSPFLPTTNPDSHIIYEGTLSSGSMKAHDIDRSYENRDNQSETLRTRYQALWLELTPENSGNYEASITTEAYVTL